MTFLPKFRNWLKSCDSGESGDNMDDQMNVNDDDIYTDDTEPEPWL